MAQKVIRIGNSTGVIIPKALLEDAGLKPGSQVVIEKEANGILIVREKGKTRKKTSITPEFLDIIDKVNRQYGVALKKLAQK